MFQNARLKTENRGPGKSIKIEEEDPAKMIEKSKLKAAAKAKASSAGIKKSTPAIKKQDYLKSYVKDS